MPVCQCSKTRRPVVNGEETKWRFNTKFDYYAKKAADEAGTPNVPFAFYGNKGALPKGDLKAAFAAAEGKEQEKVSCKNKVKIFFRPFMKNNSLFSYLMQDFFTLNS